MGEKGKGKQHVCHITVCEGAPQLHQVYTTASLSLSAKTQEASAGSMSP